MCKRMAHLFGTNRTLPSNLTGMATCHSDEVGVTSLNRENEIPKACVVCKISSYVMLEKTTTLFAR